MSEADIKATGWPLFPSYATSTATSIVYSSMSSTLLPSAEVLGQSQ